MNSKIQNTVLLLNTIAKRLSTRQECKGVEYRIDITKTGVISFSPLVYVYPNKYHRKDTDKIEIVRFVLQKYFPRSIRTIDDKIVIKNNTFIPGSYIYQTSFDKKSRRWFQNL